MHFHFGARDGKKKGDGEGERRNSKLLTFMTTILYMENCDLMNQCILVCIFEELVDLLQDRMKANSTATQKKKSRIPATARMLIFLNNEVVLWNINYTSVYTELSEAISCTAWIHLPRQTS